MPQTIRTQFKPENDSVLDYLITSHGAYDYVPGTPAEIGALIRASIVVADRVKSKRASSNATCSMDVG